MFFILEVCRRVEGGCKDGSAELWMKWVTGYRGCWRVCSELWRVVAGFNGVSLCIRLQRVAEPCPGVSRLGETRKVIESRLLGLKELQKVVEVCRGLSRLLEFLLEICRKLYDQSCC